MVSEKVQEILRHEGVVTIVSQGEKEPHLACTWNSYIILSGGNKMLIPAGGLNVTEQNVEKNSSVQLALGSREVQGTQGPGTGFLIKGNGAFLKNGPEFDTIKGRFPWARAAFEVTVNSEEQMI